MVDCLKCRSSEEVVKSGILRGKQRFFCKNCQVHFTVRDPGEKTRRLSRHQTTIVDVARFLGIAPSTVSRALHGHPDVNDETRALIVQTASSLNYQPNRLAYSLVKSRTNLVGIIVPEFHNQFFPDVIRGAQEIVTERGYNLMIMQSNEKYTMEVANAEIMLENQVEGILCSVAQETNNFDHLETFLKRGIPLVLFNRVIPQMEVPKVVVDDFEGAFRVVEHLIHQGYSRIAHLGGPRNLLVSRERLRGYIAALNQYGLPVEKDLIVHSELSASSCRIYGQYLLDRSDKPDAIFALNDPIAIELILLARARRISIPDELGIAGFSDDRVSEFIEPGLTTMRQPTVEMGREAARILMDMVLGNTPEVSDQKVLRTDLVIRGSSLKVKGGTAKGEKDSLGQK